MQASELPSLRDLDPHPASDAPTNPYTLDCEEPRDESGEHPSRVGLYRPVFASSKDSCQPVDSLPAAQFSMRGGLFLDPGVHLHDLQKLEVGVSTLLGFVEDQPRRAERIGVVESRPVMSGDDDLCKIEAGRHARIRNVKSATHRFGCCRRDNRALA